MPSISAILGWTLILLLVLLIVLGTLSESHRQQVRRLHSQGYNQTQIANMTGLSRYKVRKHLGRN